MNSDYKKVDSQAETNCPVMQMVEAPPRKNKKRSKIDTALCWLYILLIITMITTLVLGMVYETEAMAQEIQWMSDKIKENVNSSNWALSYTVYFLAQVGFHLFFLPGLTFWNALIGYYMDSVWKAFLVVYIPSVISCFLTYGVVRLIFKKWCFGMCMKKRVFRAFFKESRKTPWKTSWLVRLMFIPVATKNYMMPLLEINFVQYAIPAAIFYIPYLGAMVLVGKNLNEFSQVAGKGGFSSMNGWEKFQFCFTAVLGTATVLILIWFAWITCKKMKELGEQEKLEEERMAAEGIIDVDFEQPSGTNSKVKTEDVRE